MSVTPHLLGLGSFAFLLAAGQLLFKSVAVRNPQVNAMPDVLRLFQDPVLWLALGLYGASTILWIFLLQRVPLSRAYPFVALAFVLVPIGAAVFFGERLSVQFALGTALTVGGVYLCGVVR